MSSQPLTWDDRAFKRALRAYLDLRGNVNPKQELRRRAKNVGLKLVKIYKKESANPQKIASKIQSLGKRVKIRPKIRAKAKIAPQVWTHKKMIAAELRARKAATGFTATGWFPAVEQLGGSPRDKPNRKGPRRGKLIEKLTGNNQSETLVNSQPGASTVSLKAGDAEQKALDQETADMVAYIVRRQQQAARRNGL
jgi:hypothetical protein